MGDFFRGAWGSGWPLSTPTVSPHLWLRYLIPTKSCLRYGETPGIEMENSLLRILLIQSPILKRFNLEILVSHIDTTRSVSMDQGLAISTKHDILVPSLELQASADGRSTVIGYPVHKALLYGRGVGDALAIGRFTASWLGRGSYSDMIQFAIDLNLPPDTHNDQAEGRVIAVDIERASSALQRFRVSPQNATLFEEQWFQSRVPTLVAWLFQDLDDRNRSLKAPIRHLIQSLLEDSDRKITEAELANVRSIAESSVPEDTRQNLQESLSIWAEHAHAELRQELDSAFHGRRWRRLKWWKLFWRVDDVDMIASEILQRRWLVQAEKDLIWIAGRIEGVGFFRSTKSPAPITSPSSERVEESQSRQTSGRNPPLPSFTGTTVSTADEGIVQLPPFGPWPLHISLARVHLLNETIPSLEWLGQVLTLQTLSTVILSSATSALLYVSWSGASAYEASAVAGLGIVWSMRRLQRRWEKARGFWESEVREEGRKALKETEDTVATIIETEGRFKEDVADVEERNAARASIDQARQALEQLR